MASQSRALPLGAPMPPVQLTNVVDNTAVAVAPGRHGALVMFLCNHCPYVIHIRRELVSVAHEALDAGFTVAAINSNSVKSHPQDGPPHMAALAREEKWRFPFLFDESQAVARAFGAACTPELYLFDSGGALVYHGQFDDSRPGNRVAVTGADLRAALAAAAAGAPPLASQKVAVGCGIKWA